jgi:DNA-binding LytR/AlgR family response regulator
MMPISTHSNFRTTINYSYPRGNRFIRVQLNNRKQTIDVLDIAFLKSDSNYTIFHFKNGDKHISAFTMKFHIDSIQINNQFFRINRSVYVNRDYILRIGNNKVLLKNMKEYSISRRRLTSFREFLAS